VPALGDRTSFAGSRRRFCLGAATGQRTRAGREVLRRWEPRGEISPTWLRPEKSRTVARARGFESPHLHVTWARTNRCPTGGPAQRWSGPLHVWDPEVGLGVLVGADVDAVDEFVEELLDHVGAVVSDGSPRPFVDATAS
jgi:hypothetical protein